ncbi:hypothetical protein XspCFBP7912_04110 [Xanthomonas sp. CFBP 7912]|nr:hypothetical protein XspCFBP7912_04110 [Xanthomonas sp. CFBP 7912]RJS05134.1 hypothetical protein XnspCFBP7698_02530 [Xanthomonas sp. CFBP 7698]
MACCDKGSDDNQAQLAVVWRIISNPCRFAMLGDAPVAFHRMAIPTPRRRSVRLAAGAATN